MLRKPRTPHGAFTAPGFPPLATDMITRLPRTSRVSALSLQGHYVALCVKRHPWCRERRNILGVLQFTEHGLHHHFFADSELQFESRRVSRCSLRLGHGHADAPAANEPRLEQVNSRRFH